MKRYGAIARWLTVLAMLFTTAGAASQDFATTRVVDPGVLDRPLFLVAPPGDFSRVFVLEQHAGAIRILRLPDHALVETPFLVLDDLSTGGEQGVLGLAFHPEYAQNGRFFVYYTRSGGDSVLSEFEVSQADPDVADPSERVILRIAQPQTNHNGGWIGFGPDDGYLYVASGDGGGGNDDDSGHTPGIGNAQDITNNHLGKILRIDVDADDFPQDDDRNYAIPDTNPFVDATGDDEIWSYGLRNPWRAAFDPESGDLYLGDVGQGKIEEVDLQPALQGGANFGWRLREGTGATPGGVGGARPAGALDPIFEYTQASAAFSGCSVTGGVVYRGPVASLRGQYFLSDFCTAEIWSLRFDGSEPEDFDGGNFTDLTNWTGDPRFSPDEGSLAWISSFGEDAAGNLYVVQLGTRNGTAFVADTGQIFRVPEPEDAVGMLSAMTALLVLSGLHAPGRRRGR